MNRPKPKITWLAGVAALVLAGFVVASFIQDPGTAPPLGPAPPCPQGFVDRPAEGTRMMARLRTTADGRELLDALEAEVRWCFGAMPVPAVTQDRVLMMDADAPFDDAVARAGHLLHHVHAGMPFPSEIGADTECDAVVEEAIEREAVAYALELRLRRALEITTARYEFEGTFWQTAEGEQSALIERYLLEHPDGALHIDPLVAGYRQRCEMERARAR